MAIFAGIVALDPNREVPAEWAKHLGSRLSRRAGDSPSTFSGRRSALAWLALESPSVAPAFIDDTGKVSLVAGAPLALVGTTEPSHQAEIHGLHRAWREDSLLPLLRSRGTYCAAHVDTERGNVRLIADKLGVRPIYYTVQDRLLFFATALRIIQQSAFQRIDGDLQALLELASLGFTLADRTPYRQVHAVRAGQFVDLLGEEVVSTFYWRWDRSEPPARKEIDVKEVTRDLMEAFDDAVVIRAKSHRKVVAFLSGGLDSRSVVASLRQNGLLVHTINFAPERSADLVLGRLAAEKLGTHHFDSLPPNVGDFWRRMYSGHAEWREQVSPGSGVEAPFDVWSGEGGERILSSDLPEALTANFRAGPNNGPLESYLQRRHSLPNRPFHQRVRYGLAQLLRREIADALAFHKANDPSYRLHLFYLAHETRGNLREYYEDLDLHRIELIMPFLDAEFVRRALECPVDLLLRHRLYHEWIKLFPAEVANTPWQAYPWAEPCPVAIPQGLRSQWDSWHTFRELRRIWRELAKAVAEDMEHPCFPDWILDRTSLRIASWSARLGIGRYVYMLNAARPFLRYRPDPEGCNLNPRF